MIRQLTCTGCDGKGCGWCRGTGIVEGRDGKLDRLVECASRALLDSWYVLYFNPHLADDERYPKMLDDLAEALRGVGLEVGTREENFGYIREAAAMTPEERAKELGLDRKPS